jgi:hypothetical protein
MAPKDVGHVDGFGYKKSGNYFTDEEVAELRERFFSKKEEFPLHQCLEDVAMWYFADRDIPKPPSGKAHKKLIGDAENKAAQLHECLEKLSLEDRGFLSVTTGIDSSSRERDLLNLKAALRKLLKNVPDPKKTGAGRKDHRRRFVRHLRELYRNAGGTGPEYTQDPGSGEYGGPFMKFMDSVCSYAGINEHNRSLGDALKDILKAKK